MILKLWAKKEREAPQEMESNYHPLFFHLLDVATVTRELWNLVLKRDMKATLSHSLGIDDESTSYWVAFWAGLHDLGKASPAFQGKWELAKNNLTQAGLKFPQILTIPPHGVITAAALEDLLSNLKLPPPLAHRIAVSVGGHHGVFPRAAEIEALTKEVIGKGLWNNIRQDIFNALAKLFHISQVPIPQEEPKNPFFVMLSGLVSVADWIGSNQDFFPFAGQDIDILGYSKEVSSKAKKALNSLGWLGWSPPVTPKKFFELFPAIKSYCLRPLQEGIIKLAEKLITPGLVIVEAPMGEGKTEAAMYLADHWALTLGQRGCYFALPTQATSNQMFGRIQEFLQHRYSDDLVNLQLLHGHASLSGEFQVLRDKAKHLFIPDNVETETGEPQKGDVIAAEWFTYRKRGLLAPFGVGTIDQALLSILKTKHFFVRLFGLSHKTVVIDEVHAYDAYMTKLLERLLEWLAASNSSVVILSATLPRDKRQALAQAYVRGLGMDRKLSSPEEVSYPRIIWLSSSTQGAIHVDASSQFSRLLNIEWVRGDIQVNNPQSFTLGVRLQETLSGGGCAAIICNTVGRAQEVYQTLKFYFSDQDTESGEQELYLFHARYLFEERERREIQVLHRFGKHKGSRPHRAVLVATQVIEQSLDLDFDLMITEMAPIDLLLQRSGRLHRHRHPRPPGLENPILWIMLPELVNQVPNFGRGSESVYDRHVLLRSWLALQGHKSIAVPDEIETLIEEVYSDKKPPRTLSSELLKCWQESHQVLTRKKDEYESQALNFRVLPPHYRDDIMEDTARELEEDNPEVHQSLQALTRLSDPTISLVCLYGTAEIASFDPYGQDLIDLIAQPGRETTLNLLRRSVTISHRGLVPWLIEQGLKPSGWIRHPLLRHHRLVLLDKDHSARLGKYTFQIDSAEGVVISKHGKEDE
ncbi:MAG: CRISPR-associated helicase Cas3' [Deltaproteobacteria bacterium]|nr:CRISPR-associated helicase Cas3' [Deltaproteobacteria bacterium]